MEALYAAAGVEGRLAASPFFTPELTMQDTMPRLMTQRTCYRRQPSLQAMSSKSVLPMWLRACAQTKYPICCVNVPAARINYHPILHIRGAQFA
jgi:hypothetical protein